MTCACSDCVARADYRAELAMAARRRALLRALAGLLVFMAVILAVACRPQYVQQPPPPDAAATGGALGTGGAQATAGVPDTGGSAPDAECTWVPSGRSARYQVRITGGDAAPAGAFPWTCAVEQDTGWQYCGCTLVAPDRCVTAAHCQVAVGDVVHCAATDLRTGGVRAPVIQARNNPGWNGTTGGSDVTVLVLGRQITSIPYALLPDHDVHADYPVSLTAIGWGAQHAGGSTTPVQRYVEIPLVSRYSCEQSYGVLGGDMLCAGDPGTGKDTCQGDSGGPLVQHSDVGWVLVGITSWGAECATAPGVYTDVWVDLPWIKACAGLQ